MKPTTFGSKPVINVNAVTVATTLPQEVHASARRSRQDISGTFPITLTKEQNNKVLVLLENTPPIQEISLTDLAVLGNEAELALRQMLESFLGQINTMQNPQIYELLGRLSDGINKEDLPALADNILTPVSGKQKVFNLFRTSKGRQKVAEEAWQRVQGLVRGKTKTLVDLLNGMEGELNQEVAKLAEAIGEWEKLKTAYGDCFDAFVVAVAFTSAYLGESKQSLKQLKDQVNPQNAQQMFALNELNDRLQQLESRELTLETVLRSIPARQLVIQQLQGAGVRTYQEVVSTSATKFSNIMSTLLELHAAMMVKGVQQLSQRGAELRDNLEEVNARLRREVVTAAANAPGDNRVAQAEKLKKIVDEEVELRNLVNSGRVQNTEKFAKAREILAQTQKALLALDELSGKSVVAVK